MELQFQAKSDDILSSVNCVILLEIFDSPSPVLATVLSSPSLYQLKSTLIDYILTYARPGQKDLLLLNIGPNASYSQYFSSLAYIVDYANRLYKRELNIYLSNTYNFSDFVQAAVDFCDKNQTRHINLTFYSSPENYALLFQKLEELKQTIINRKKSIIDSIVNTLTCNKCSSFCYEPFYFECCRKIVCKACARRELCPGCGKKGMPDGNAIILQTVLNKCPFYCTCGAAMAYSERKEHIKICLGSKYFRCKICREMLFYTEFLAHLGERHNKQLLDDQFF
jgi:hypothetical protein